MSFENSVSELLEEFLRSLKNLVLIDPRSFKETSRDKNSFKKNVLQCFSRTQEPPSPGLLRGF